MANLALKQLLVDLKPKSIAAEFIAMTIFIYIGCGTVMSYLAPSKFNYNDTPQREEAYLPHVDSTFGVIVPFVFGITVMVLAYAASILQAGQLNPAVTIGLALIRKIKIVHAIGMVLVQFLGSLLAVGFLAVTIPNAQDSSFGANSLSPGVKEYNAFIGEAFLSFVLMVVVQLMGECQDGLSPNSEHEHGGITAPVAVGFTVFVAHGVLLPIDGCSINPARSFGPAVASGNWEDYWIFIVAPVCGALIAVFTLNLLQYLFPQMQEQEVAAQHLSAQTIQAELTRIQSNVEVLQGGGEIEQLEDYKSMDTFVSQHVSTIAPSLQEQQLQSLIKQEKYGKDQQIKKDEFQEDLPQQIHATKDFTQENTEKAENIQLA